MKKQRSAAIVYFKKAMKSIEEANKTLEKLKEMIAA
jgi:hypothetical protein